MTDTVDGQTHQTVDDITRLAEQAALRIVELGVMATDADGVVVYVNERARNWLGGVDPHAVLGVIIEPALKGARIVKYVEPALTKGSHLKLVSAPLLDDGGEIVGSVTLFEDNTAQALSEAAQRELVANVGHELKTPVAAMGLLAETLVNERNPEASNNLAERLAQESVRAAQVVDDLLDLGSRRSRQSTVSPVKSLCEQAITRLITVAESRNIQIEVHGPDLNVVGNPVDVVSALYHLVDNALRYSPNDSTITVRVRETEQNTCDIAVVDNGIGISAANLDRIFERFYRVDSAASDEARSGVVSGTGLGLAIVKHAIERNGGCVRVESIEGSGSVFTLRLNRGED